MSRLPTFFIVSSQFIAAETAEHLSPIFTTFLDSHWAALSLHHAAALVYNAFRNIGRKIKTGVPFQYKITSQLCTNIHY